MAINYIIQPNYKLPANIRADYDELEYIQSTGSQCILSGITDWRDIEFKCKVNSQSKGLFIGAYQTSPKNRFYPIVIEQNAEIRYTYGSNSVVGTGVGSFNTDYELDIKMFGGNQSIIVNGNEKANSNYPYSFDTTRELCIFCSNDSDDGYYLKVSAKLYYLQIIKHSTNGDILLRDYVPAKRKSDNTLGLYDLVSNTFFTNAGSGTFLGGEVIKDYIEVENATFNGTALDKVIFNGVTVWENATILSLGNGQSFNLKSVYPNYANLTVDDFMVSSMSNFSETGWTAKQIYQDGYGKGESELYKSYNASTGILTCYVTYLYTYKDSNGTSPRYYDKKLNVNAYLILKPKADLGTATTFDVASVYPDYTNLTVDDFYIQTATKYSKGFTAKWIYADRSSGVAKSEIVKSYNPSTGQLTCYIWFKWDYRDSNGTTPQSFDEHLPCHVFIAKK